MNGLLTEKQADEGLDGLDRPLREINNHYHCIQANVILTASLNFVTARVLEFDYVERMDELKFDVYKLINIISQVSPHAKSYTSFLRNLSGNAEAFAMFTFPPEVPVKSYVQAVPDLCLFLNYFK